MAELKLLSAKTLALHAKFGFAMVRDCGEGLKGLALAFVIGYFDALILAQKTMYNNYQFIDKVKGEYFNENEFPLVHQLILTIKSKSAIHDNFASRLRSEQQFVAELVKLSWSKLFNLSANIDIYEALAEYSRLLNIQIFIYDNENLSRSVKQNRFMGALVISIFMKSSDPIEKYFALYHTDYKVISLKSLNCSSEYEDSPPVISPLQQYDDFIYNAVRTLWESRHTIDRDALANYYYELKRMSKRNWCFEDLICKMLLFEKCGSCNFCVHKFVFSCGCKFCPACLMETVKINKCIQCNRPLVEGDTSLLQIMNS